jgi:guanylate kinase
MEGLLVIISGPSGSGKGTVVKKLDAAKGYARSISVTTRQPRAGETDGKDYFFTTPDEFTRMRQDNELLEHALFVGHNYGTPRLYVEKQIAEGRVVVLEIEIQGALQVREKFPDAVLIFLMPPTMVELSRRLNSRATEDAVTIDARLKKALEEVPLISEYDYLVINDEVECAVAKIDAIVDAERLRPRRCTRQINQFFI